MTKPALLTLVRHGETSANLDGVWHGSTDTALTPRGLAQAERVAGYLAEHHANAASIYCSQLQRARHTANAIALKLGIEPRVDEDLAEYDLGSWEGTSYADLFNVHKLWDHMLEDPDFAPHGGESPRQLTARFSRALRRISDDHSGQRVVIVSHGAALSMVLGHLLEGDHGRFGRVMENCAVSELVMDPNPSLLSFNISTHLDGI